MRFVLECDESRATLKGKVGPHPLEKDQKAIAKTDQVYCFVIAYLNKVAMTISMRGELDRLPHLHCLIVTGRSDALPIG
jgi:hypothetical protein